MRGMFYEDSNRIKNKGDSIMVRFCPRCNQPYTTMPHVGDFVHRCNSGESVLDNESVFVIGDWKDYTGSGTVMWGDIHSAGRVNTLSPRARAEGEDWEPINVHGDRKSTHRLRQHLEYIDG